MRNTTRPASKPGSSTDDAINTQPVIWFSLLWLSLGLVALYATLFANTRLLANTRAADTTIIGTDELGGTERYLAYVSTDKPVYRAGENVYLRTVILHAGDNTPAQPGNHTVVVKISGPKGDIVHEGYANDNQNSIGYQWTVPDGTAGGQYTATVTSPALGLPETTRTFDIRAFRAPRIKSQIQFTRDGYGAGDQVRASVSLERAEGSAPEGAMVTAIARLDGREVYRGPAVPVSADGIVDAVFNLPEKISKGDGSLSFVIEDGGVVETASKSLPILLNTLDIAFYPEGGELIAGVQGKVYFQALLTNGKPADVEGFITEVDDNNPVANFRSSHEGRGVFQFTPQAGKRYKAVFSAPSGITEPSSLPDVKRSGTAISSSQDSYEYANPIEVTITSNAAHHPARVTLYKRDQLLDSVELSTAGTNTVFANRTQLNAKDAEGVLIATVWDNNGRPLAERLVYRKPRFGLNVALQLSDGPFIPGAEVSIDIQTTDDSGNPVEAMVGVTVTDDTVLELIDKREQAPRLPVMVYLENDVLDLADAHVYLDKDNPIADTAIDLLLGTQGWRRFILTDYPQIKQQYPAHSTRALAEASRRQPVFRLGNEVDRAMVRAMEFNVQIMQAEVAMEAMPAQARQIKALDEADAVADNNAVAEVIVAAPPMAEIEQRAEIQQPAEPEAAEEQLAADIAQGADADQLLIAPVNAKRLADNAVRPRPGNGGYIREYAYQTRANRKPNDRIDFTETLYWNSGIKTGARDGKATMQFSLSDSVTTFRVMADAHGRNGAIGSGDTMIASVEPFYITAKMPQQVIASDVIELPVTLVNTTSKTIANASVNITGKGIETTQHSAITLAPGARLRQVISVSASAAGTYPITITAQAGEYSDTVTRQLTVNAAGFPIAFNAGGLLSSTTPHNTTVVIPADVTDGSLQATASVYPSPLASMEEALNALLREPHGCFEQTSSTNYPLVMAQQYFDSHTGVDPATIARSRDLLKTGYQKLIGFESEDNGYEWFGANPAHEALTAYGLMEFTDMAKVMQIDDDMLSRTRNWLLSRRDGNGGFSRNDKALDSFGRAPAATTDAYIVWSLLESGQSAQSLSKEIKHVKDSAFNGNDSYIDALAANILYLAGDSDSADLLSEKLIKATAENGAVEGSTTSITNSGGDSLTIETTSLALLAWLRNDEQFAAQVEHSIKWLFERSKAGRFGSTQSTVLALKAINTYDAARAVPKQPGTVQLYVNGSAVGQPVSFDTQSKGAIALPDFAKHLSTGENRIELQMTDGSKMPFALEITYNTSKPASASTTPVTMTTSLSHTRITEGEPVELQATVTTGDNNVPTPIAIIGIPAGLELRHDQLKELIGADRISAYEVRDSELILYWRALKAGDTRVIPVSLTADIPGTYNAPASRVYPYYTDEQKHWLAGHSIEVVAK